MVSRNDIISYTDKLLNSASIPDSSQNGLQVEGKETVRRAVFGVSATEEFLKLAVKEKADLIVVHHGLFWEAPLRMTGPFKRKIEILLKNNISLAAWHLPLDMHAALGNNAVLAKILKLKNIKPFGSYKGLEIGFKGELSVALSAAQINEKYSAALDAKGRLIDFSRTKVKHVGVVSGGAHTMFGQAISDGLDMFITGSADEFVQEASRESGTRFLSLGHYNSEKAGVNALMENIKKKFKISTVFIDVPNQF